MKKSDLTTTELKWLLKSQGIKVQPAYRHKDYVFTSFTMPNKIKQKLDKMCKNEQLSRSKIIQMLIANTDEKNLFKTLEKMK